MTQVRATEKIQLDEAAIQEMKAFSPQEGQEDKDSSSPTGLALHQIFNQDVLNEWISQSVEVETFTPSLWQRILAWFKGTEKDSTSQVSTNKTSLESTEIKSEALSPVPVLDPPENIPEDLRDIKLPPVSKKDDFKTKLSSSEFEEALSLMSEQTIEAIMFIIFKTQIQVEKENANTAEKTFSKYLDFQKLQQKVLCEIKDALVKDEKIVQRFGTVQNIASYLAGVTAFAATFGLLGPFWGFLASGTAAGLTAVTLGVKAYFQNLMNEHGAQHEGYVHHNQYYNDRTDDSRNRLMAAAEADMVFRERWIHFLRRLDKMRKLIFKK